MVWQGNEPGFDPFTYRTPVLTADSVLEFLCAKPPPPIRVLTIGYEQPMEEDADFHRAINNWVETAPRVSLEQIVPTVRRYWEGKSLEGGAPYQLMQADETRGIPTRDELAALSQEFDCEELRELVDSLD